MAVIAPATCQSTPIIPGEQKKCVFITIAAATAADTIDLNLYGFTGVLDYVHMMDIAAAPATTTPCTWAVATNVVTVGAGPAGGAISLLVVGDA